MYRLPKHLYACATLALAALGVAPFWASSARAGGADACALQFNVPTTGLPVACLFVGRDESCGKTITAVFAGDGDMLVVGIASDDEQLQYVAGEVISENEASLLHWAPDMNAAPSIGRAHLEDGGRTLRIHFNRDIDLVRGCPADEHVVPFAEMVDAAIGQRKKI